jgi:hypothetical protein
LIAFRMLLIGDALPSVNNTQQEKRQGVSFSWPGPGLVLASCLEHFVERVPKGLIGAEHPKRRA